MCFLWIYSGLLTIQKLSWQYFYKDIYYLIALLDSIIKYLNLFKYNFFALESAQPNTKPENRSLLPSSTINSPTSSSVSQEAQLYPSVVFPANCYCPASLINSILAAFHFAEDVVRRDMLIANNLIGCVIGRGGVKINEIRKVDHYFLHTFLPQLENPLFRA